MALKVDLVRFTVKVFMTLCCRRESLPRVAHLDDDRSCAYGHC